MNKENLIRSIYAGFFSVITIGILTFLTYKTEYGIFLIASFGSSMVLLYGYPESPFAQPKNIFFGHLVTAIVGVGVALMIILNVTHPPAGGNPIIIIMGSVSYEYLIYPVITGVIIILIFGVFLTKK